MTKNWPMSAMLGPILAGCDQKLANVCQSCLRFVEIRRKWANSGQNWPMWAKHWSKFAKAWPISITLARNLPKLGPLSARFWTSQTRPNVAKSLPNSALSDQVWPSSVKSRPSSAKLWLPEQFWGSSLEKGRSKLGFGRDLELQARFWPRANFRLRDAIWRIARGRRKSTPRTNSEPETRNIL